MDSVLLFVLGIVIFVIGLAVSIALHELGHLSFAKLFGVRVTQYMIGFGRTLWSFRRGETEYGIKAIPLGGYIAMIGMFPPKNPGGKARNANTGFYSAMVQDGRDSSAESIPEGEDNRAFYRLAPWKRIVVMFAGPFMNLIIAFILLAIIISGIGTQQAIPTLQSVSQCVLPASSTQTTCKASDPESPAAAAGLLPGDTIVSIGGTTITDWSQLTKIVSASPGKKLAMVVERKGEKVDLTVTPKLTSNYVTDAQGNYKLDAQGNKVTAKVGMIGVGAETGLVTQPVTNTFPVLGTQIAGVAGVVINLPQRMVGVWNAAFGTQKRDANGPIGIVGVGRLAGDIASNDQIPVIGKVQTILSLLASLNIALFVFNMVPLLPLDGGHIIGAVWEWIRRGFAKLFKRRDPGPVDMAKLMPLTFAVVVILGAMSALLLYADIVKPVTLPG